MRNIESSRPAAQAGKPMDRGRRVQVRRAGGVLRRHSSLLALCAALSCTLVLPAGASAFQARGSLEVTPESASLLEGQSVQLTAVVKDRSGNVLRRSVNWTSSSSNVTVDGSGRVMAVRSGRATVTAASGRLRVSVRITVAEAATTSSIGSISTDTEPSSLSTSTTTSTSTSTSTSTTTQTSTSSSGSPDVGRDPSNYGTINEILSERRLMDPMGVDRIELGEEGGQKFIRLNYPANSSNCRDDYVLEPSVDWVGRGAREVWVETWVRPSRNWTTQNGCSVGVDHKSLLIGTNQGAGGSPRFGLHIGYGGSPTTYDGTFPGSGDGNGAPGPYQSVFTGPDIRGKWTRIRMHLRLGDDGVADIWFDDQLVRSKRGVAMNAQSIDFLTRGNLNQGPPVDMYMDWGATNVYLSNPGWPGQG